MVKIRKKQYTEENVYEATLARIRHLYEMYDEVVVSFSGGKDSTAMLLCTIDVATELGRLPVKAIFYDEEAIHPPTIEYVERVRDDPNVDLDWYCLPIQHRNACSNRQPFWHCWHPDEEDIWVRPMPECGIKDHPRFEWGQSMQAFGVAHYAGTSSVVIQGIRTQESIRRYRVVAMKKEDNYISDDGKRAFAYPIYDWTSEDVWRLVAKKGADYNKMYDVLNKTNKFEHFLEQRCCPPFGEEPLRGLHEYAECWPEMWERMVNRLPGVATAARYGNTELYNAPVKPDGITWRTHVSNLLETYDAGPIRDQVARQVNSTIKVHKGLTNDPIPPHEYHPLTGISWRFLAKIVARGDFKDRIVQTRVNNAIAAQKAAGITQEEAEARYGKKS